MSPFHVGPSLLFPTSDMQLSLMPDTKALKQGAPRVTETTQGMEKAANQASENQALTPTSEWAALY